MRFAQESGPTLLLGAAAGAAVMYLLDAEGRRRRRVAVDRTGSISRRTARRLEKRARDLRNRAQGLVAQTRGRLKSDEPSDETLVARVRSELGHHVRHAGAIDTSADGGVVTLRGAALAGELGELLAGVRGVRGVREVRNELTPYEDEGELLGHRTQG